MNTFYKYFTFPSVLTVVVLLIALFCAGPTVATLIGILIILEVSLSFDNAVVNAKELGNLTPKYRKMFLEFGLPVAVFGMRFLFPLVIVAVVGHLGPVAVWKLVTTNHQEFARILTSSHTVVAGFGGAFLLMVALNFFLDSGRDVKWISVIETPLAVIGKLDVAQIFITVAALLGYSTYLGGTDGTSFLVAGLIGMLVYLAVDSLDVLLGAEEDHTGALIRTGIGALVYLELLDASFSFDGVIGAFAISNSLPIITCGLGCGAFFVRSLTLMLVDKGTLDSYKYLEHGAQFSILALTAIMFIGVRYEVPEVVTGLIAAGFIGLAVITSIISNKRELAGVPA